MRALQVIIFIPRMRSRPWKFTRRNSNNFYQNLMEWLDWHILTSEVMSCRPDWSINDAHEFDLLIPTISYKSAPIQKLVMKRSAEDRFMFLQFIQKMNLIYYSLLCGTLGYCCVYFYIFYKRLTWSIACYLSVSMGTELFYCHNSTKD